MNKVNMDYPFIVFSQAVKKWAPKGTIVEYALPPILRLFTTRALIKCTAHNGETAIADSFTIDTEWKYVSTLNAIRFAGEDMGIFLSRRWLANVYGFASVSDAVAAGCNPRVKKDVVTGIIRTWMELTPVKEVQ